MPTNNWSQKKVQWVSMMPKEEIGNINKHSFRKQDVTTPFGLQEFQR